MINTGYYFIYRDPDLQEYIIIKHDKYKLSKINDLVEEFVLSDMALPSQAKFLSLLEKKPNLILDIYNAMNGSGINYKGVISVPLTDTQNDIEELILDEPGKEIELEVDYEPKS